MARIVRTDSLARNGTFCPVARVVMAFGLAAIAALGQSGPDAREIPVPPIHGAPRSMPGAKALAVSPEMPDVMTMNGGGRVRTAAQWKKRREQMREILAYYAVGHMPPAPGNVTGEVLLEEGTYRLMRLRFGPARKLELQVGLLTPQGAGPFPAVVLLGGTPPGAVEAPRLPQGPNQGKGEDVLLLVGPGDKPPAVRPAAPVAKPAELAARFSAVLERGYAVAMFNPNDCAEDTTLRNRDGSWAFRDTRFPPAYPGYDWGILGAWAWGASRVADYLETDPRIDRRKLIVTGASRNGKAAMIAGAFDDRFMAAPVVTGGGGVGAYRFAGPRGSETLDIMQKKYPNWFSPQLHEFWGERERLPFDEHWFLALCAPRPFIALEGLTDRISLPEAVRQSMAGARPAYALLGAGERLGVHYSRHGHAFTEEDWTAMLDFADWHWRARKPAERFDRFPTDAEIDAGTMR